MKYHINDTLLELLKFAMRFKMGGNVLSHKRTLRTVKTYLKGGIEVILKNREELFEVVIVIPKAIIFEEKIINRKNKDVKITLKQLSQTRDTAYIKLKAKYRKDTFKNIKEEAIKVMIKTESLSGNIVVYPRFYLSKTMKKAIKKEKDQTNTVLIHYSSKPSISKYGFYTTNNATRPYRGGLMTPN